MKRKPLFTVLSKKAALKYKPNGKAIVIRMLEPYEKNYELEGLYVEETIIRVHDVVPQAGLPSNTVLFQGSHVAELLHYIDKHKDTVEEIVIHCHAGQSRSPAIAIGIGWHLGLVNVENDIMTKRVTPNPHIMEVFAKHLDKWGVKKEFIQRFQDND